MIASTFSLGEVPAPQRAKYWHNAICQTYLLVDCQRLDVESFEGRIEAHPFGQMELSEVTSPPMAYYRDQEQISHSDDEFFQLVLAIAGNGIVEQAGKRTHFKPGDMVIYSSSEQSSISYPEGSTTQVVKIPRPLLADRIGSPDRVCGALVSSETPLGAMARSVILESVRLCTVGGPPDVRLCNGALDILATAIDTSLPCEVAGRSAAPLNNVKRYIEEHLTDPDLDVQRVANHGSVSVRTLNRMFAAEGTTANIWIWSRRLARAHKLLSEGKAKQVGQAAFDSGFNDLSHFGRAFKKRYGLLPHEILRSAR
jgi:AraC-like DNA-binding protein